MTEAVNPYAAPRARVDEVAANPEAEATRRAHITQEASIKAVGFLYYLGGVGILFAAFGALSGAREAPSGPYLAMLFFALAIGQFVAGWGVRKLRPWARIVGCVISAIGLLGFPVGTLVNAYILYLFLSKKGRTIFSPQYQDVIAATPHVKYKTSIIVWIFLALIVALIAFALIGAFAGR